MQNEPQWRPDAESAKRTDIARFNKKLIDGGLVDYTDPLDFAQLQKWSATSIEDFWASLAEFYRIKFKTPYKAVLSSRNLLEARWFEGATLNFADHIPFAEHLQQTAVRIELEDGSFASYTYAQLQNDIAAFGAYLDTHQLELGDRIVGYLPNSYLGIVAFYAAASRGLVWSHVGLDYNAGAAADRLAQLEPKILVTDTGYTFRGAHHDRRQEVYELVNRMPSLLAVVFEDEAPDFTSAKKVETANPKIVAWQEVQTTHAGATFHSIPVDFSHPLWVLFSSGTTGIPKGIVHSHGGALLEQHKTLGMHSSLSSGETFFWYTTPNWMMWNVQISSLLFGATAILYVGDPLYPDASRLWDVVEQNAVTVYGTNPGLLGASAATAVQPGKMPALRSLLSTGAALPATMNEWVRQELGERVQLGSVSGGTDIVGAFVSSNPLSPVWDGMISAKALGVALYAWNEDGESVTDEVGELVVTAPMPSMPIYFWNDPRKEKLKDAYFSKYEGVWRQGDWITVHDNGSISMHGRSDATLNRNGIRLGSAEIYAALQSLKDIKDSLMVGVEQTDGSYWMPLFVVKGEAWDDDVSVSRINDAIASRASKHHLPGEIIFTEAIPYTRTGKKMEVPVKRLLQGGTLAESVSLDVTDTPEALKWFARFSESRASSS